MTLDLDNLRKLEAAATPRPWSAEHDGPPESMSCAWIAGPFDGYMGGAQTIVEWNTTGEQSHADASLIVAARNALPALLADHARLMAEVARLQEVNVTLLGDEVKLSRLLVDERDAAYTEARTAKTELARLRGLLARVETWTKEYGAALKPSGADTYGEGMRVAKWQVANLIREGGPSDE
jgi:hypothetical protein